MNKPRAVSAAQFRQPGGENLPYAKTDFQGTVAFWMRLNPYDDLPPGYVDPALITTSEGAGSSRSRETSG